MPIYKYRAITEQGLIVENKIEESSKIAVINRLKRNSLTPINVQKTMQRVKSRRTVKKNTKDISEILENIDTANIVQARSKKQTTYFDKIYHTIFQSEKITTRDLVIFTQNFYLLKKADFNNIHALNTIIDSTENLTFKGILEDILAGVEAGENMYTTMEYYGDVFPFLYINMIKVGELSGSLTNALKQAVEYLDSSASMNKKLKSILIPNITQFVFLIVALVACTLYAIPAIQNVLDSFGSSHQLPAITIWFQGFLNKVLAHWYIPTVTLIGIIIGIIYYINTPKGKYNFDYFKYKMPLFGSLIFAIDFSRIIKAMLLNLKNGMRIQEALEVGKSVSSNYVMLSIIEASINNLLIGRSWIEPIEQSNLASPMTTEMLKIGMQTDLAEMMEKLVEYMDIDIDNIMSKIMKALPQVVYAIVGALLIFFTLVILVPCIDIYMGSWLLESAGV